MNPLQLKLKRVYLLNNIFKIIEVKSGIKRWFPLRYKHKKTLISYDEGLKKAMTYSPTIAVPSALTGLTTLFGMVRGEPRRCNHLKPCS